MYLFIYYLFIIYLLFIYYLFIIYLLFIYYLFIIYFEKYKKSIYYSW
jgi:hypothetical protein